MRTAEVEKVQSAINRIAECSTWHLEQAAAAKKVFTTQPAARHLLLAATQHELWAKELQCAIADLREGAGL